MRELIIVLMFIVGCTGGNYSADHNEDEFDPAVCMDIPVGMESFQYMDPALNSRKISCADLSRCTSLLSLPAPPNVPCE